MQRLLGTLLAGLLFSQSAAALSCMRPDLARTMEDAKASEKGYQILVGRFVYPTGVPSNKTNYDTYEPIPSETHSALFKGYALADDPRLDGFLDHTPIEIKTTCAAHWCGSVPGPDREIIAFAEVRPGQPPLLEMGACPQWTFELNRNEFQIAKLRTCFDETCQSELPDPY